MLKQTKGTMLLEQTNDWPFQVSEYEQLVLSYETLARQIAHVLLSNGGVTRNMSDNDFVHYRQLAIRRDLVCHMINVMEYNLASE